ncbi:hypothetical protein O1611_g5140 [Lasiodiplodia mahajangana]|uniref:Uncharacterized protein n=1 Tax=Lasiodiplodia mahajangana TaxID=1108764 RepID=A0ACC2JLV8_9PEZI|nr:hypothetical protein O1611_g5140 [Lasiodiplodia mahajangana]
MCGIHAVITASTDSGLSPELRQSLINRGPDHLGQAQREVPRPSSDQTLRLYFTSTVLALRGDHIAKQPLEENPGTGSVLCWNGEAWRINGQPVSGNDGEAVFSMLQSSASSASLSSQDRETRIVDVLRSIEGPFAFVYYDSAAGRVYYGRDRLGRRSLLIKRSSETPSITLSSIGSAPTTGWEEVSSDGIWSVDLTTFGGISGEVSFQSHVAKLAWLPASNEEMVSSIGAFNHKVPSSEHVLDFTSPSLPILRHRLIESLKPRVLDVPEPPSAGSDIDVRIAILFSGGLDCTVLARLAHELMPMSQGIDLINVAFQNPRQVALQAKQPHLQASDIYESCPDRATGRKAFSELQLSCPGRYWRFIAVNVPFEEAMAHKAKVVSLIYPHDTEMDLSIAFALYFAARGTGDCYVDQIEWQPSPPVASTSARVLLSGLGADELFGGYSRHEAAFKMRGYSGLLDELELDVSRIGQRNLGRDDRIMAHWGREVRFPYLDEEFFRFAIGSPVWEKCDFENPFHPAVIDPAKRILRLLADQLDLPTTARQKKRAIQFGSRTAKIESATGRLRGTAQLQVSCAQQHIGKPCYSASVSNTCERFTSHDYSVSRENRMISRGSTAIRPVVRACSCRSASNMTTTFERSANGEIIYKPDTVLDVPNIDLMTMLFESESCRVPPDTIIHADAVDPSNNFTKARLLQQSKRAANVFRYQYGIGANGPDKDVVFNMATGHFMIPVVFYATVIAGGIFSSTNPSSTPDELAYQLRQTDAKVIV